MSALELTIDPEFEALLVPLSPEALDLLREQILRDGCREPLSVWKTEDGRRILLDGHNRYQICKDTRRNYQIANVKVSSREDAKLWVLERQIGRRNLTDDQRAAIWTLILEQRVVVSRAKQLEEARASKAVKPVGVEIASTESSPEAKDRIRTAIAKESGLPESKLRGMRALKKSNPDLYKRVAAGKLSLRDAKKHLRKSTPSKNLRKQNRKALSPPVEKPVRTAEGDTEDTWEQDMAAMHPGYVPDSPTAIEPEEDNEDTKADAEINRISAGEHRNELQRKFKTLFANVMEGRPGAVEKCKAFLDKQKAKFDDPSWTNLLENDRKRLQTYSGEVEPPVEQFYKHDSVIPKTYYKVLTAGDYEAGALDLRTFVHRYLSDAEQDVDSRAEPDSCCIVEFKVTLYDIKLVRGNPIKGK